MKLFIVSDLHISDTDNLGTFGWGQDEFIERMESIRNNHGIDRIILNGDVFDLYKSDFRDIEARHHRVIDYLKGIGAVFLKGNHDGGLPFGQDNLRIVNGKGERIHIEHGHRGDFINGTMLGRFATTLFYKILKLAARLSVTRRLYYAYLLHDEGLKGLGKYNSYKYLRYAVKLLRKADVVVLGHTHKMEIHDSFWRNSKKRYFNSGACTFGRFQGIILNTETLACSTINVESPYAQVRPAALSVESETRIPAFGKGILAPA
jgi:predicted phosphodiesterase